MNYIIPSMTTYDPQSDYSPGIRLYLNTAQYVLLLYYKIVILTIGQRNGNRVPISSKPTDSPTKSYITFLL